jgi:hypothetical protein
MIAKKQTLHPAFKADSHSGDGPSNRKEAMTASSLPVLVKRIDTMSFKDIIISTSPATSSTKDAFLPSPLFLSVPTLKAKRSPKSPRVNSPEAMFCFSPVTPDGV